MRVNWTELESILALRLYYQLPFGKLHKSNKDIIILSEIVNRTPSAVSMKLCNFASLDSKLINRDIKGLANRSKLDKIIWDKFSNLELLERKSNEIIEKINIKRLFDLFVKTDEAEKVSALNLSKQRKKQSFFRKLVLSNFNNKCCITGLACLPLLVASHIVPWSKDEKNRLNPQNGLLLNSIHDKAFDQGLITINKEFKIMLSDKIKILPKNDFVITNFLDYENKSITLPDKYLPSFEFIDYHNKYIFKDAL